MLATARPPLVAFNVDLATGDVKLAKSIAAELREANGGLPGVRARALPRRARAGPGVDERARPPCCTAGGDRRAHAPRAVAEAELIGLAPRAAFDGFDDVPLQATPDATSWKRRSRCY